jgi:hypothetical protein
MKTPCIEEFGETYKGKCVVADETRDIDPCSCLSVQVIMIGDNIRYFFLCEKGKDSYAVDARITIVKPPLSCKTFNGYVQRLRIRNPKWVA